MREIKFRFYDPFNETMVYQSEDVHKPNDSLYKFFTLYNAALEGENKPILMQYTCLKDANGKEIFEGDIVEGWFYQHRGNFEVVFDDGAFSLIINDEYVPCLYEANPNKNLKVIGNIYENSELLTQQPKDTDD